MIVKLHTKAKKLKVKTKGEIFSTANGKILLGRFVQFTKGSGPELCLYVDSRKDNVNVTRLVPLKELDLEALQKAISDLTMLFTTGVERDRVTGERLQDLLFEELGRRL